MNHVARQSLLTVLSNKAAAGRMAVARQFMPFGFRLILGSLIAAFLLVVLWRDIVVSKHAGEQGVYWSRFFGGTSNRKLGEGTHLKFPWDRIYIYSTRIQESHGTTELLTIDGMPIRVDWSVRYHVDPEHLPELHRNLGPKYADKVVVPEVVSSLRKVLGRYTADQIYARDELSLIGEIDQQVKERVELFHPILFEAILLLRLELPEEMSKGIVEKQLYEQQLLSYGFRLQGEQEEKKRKLIEAQGIKDFERVSRLSILKWRGIEATEQLAKSPNAKIIMMGGGQNSLPLLLNMDSTGVAAASPPPLQSSIK